MRNNRKLFLILFLTSSLTAIQFLLPESSKIVSFYNIFIYHPFQSLRNIIFSIVPFSIGDILYILALIALIYFILQCLWYILRIRKHYQQLSHTVLKSLVVLLLIYAVFILGWGGNYYKPSLASYWQLDQMIGDKDSILVPFDQYLIKKLNDYEAGYQNRNFKTIDKQAQNYYREYTDSRTRKYGVKVKASLFGNALQYFGIQGYFNPWTGEAQVNKNLPSFMLPFVICHEMAHQSGIAAEDDANLLSYAISTTVPDSVFRYSAYFNIWLYTHAKVRMRDSALAKTLLQSLNRITLAQLDTLKHIRKRYASSISDYSGLLYDGYLKLHHQKDGIGSYNKVTISAWELEHKPRGRFIEIP
ncbi:MAG: DUF3810 domain-containing protein [Bacteroidetes bacterium]|nr:DUF3810 domain-containing protein [Bacteroidota bacterium]MBS1739255.1 DUF3810 domain-containing protein [Bacteroidota bacterium]